MATCDALFRARNFFYFFNEDPRPPIFILENPQGQGTAPTPPPIPTSELEASQSDLYIAPNISFLESLLIIKKSKTKSS